MDSVDAVRNFMMVLPRIGGIIAVAPVLSGRYPAMVKAALSAVLALVVAPLATVPTFMINDLALITTVAAELAVGLTIGFVAAVAFSVIQIAGQVFDMEMGFGIVNVIDPQYGTQVPLVGSFLHILAMIVFLSLDGHHLVLAALVRSFEAVPVGTAVLRPELSGMVATLFSTMFTTAITIALPIAGAMFCTNVALGILAKTTPQMNVFVIGLPVKILGGLIILTLAVPLLGTVVTQIIDNAAAAMINVIRLLGR